MTIVKRIVSSGWFSLLLYLAISASVFIVAKDHMGGFILGLVTILIGFLIYFAIILVICVIAAVYVAIDHMLQEKEGPGA